MSSEQQNIRSFWLTLIAAAFLFDAGAIRATVLRADEIGMDIFRSAWGGVLLVYGIVLLGCIWLFFRVLQHGDLHFTFLSALERPAFQSVAWRVLGFVLFAAILFLIPFAKFSLSIDRNIQNPSYDPRLATYLFYWSCWWAALFAVAAFKVAARASWPVAFISALMIFGVAYETWIRFGAVTTYPLSMGWSEGSRYYYASLYFSKSIYGESFPLSTLHPTRYLLQSLPFLIPSLGLPAHRFWQFLLWIGMTGWATIAIATRVTLPSERMVKWFIAGGLFLFFLRMGIYYHLEPMIILPLVFVSARHPGRSLLAIAAASLWAGVSRVNWFPMPALIAVAAYILETPFPRDISVPFVRRLISYLSLPVLWVVVGLTTAVLMQVAYIPLSGNSANAEAFTSSINSDLLWYRLWPNANHDLGIVPATLLFSFPLIAIVLAAWQRRSLHFVRWIALWSMIAVLFAGSLVVSSKIGGGGDLHNMDTFAVMISVVAAYFVGGQVAAESGGERSPVRPWTFLSLAVLIPVTFIVFSIGPRSRYNELKNEKSYQTLVQVANEASKTGPVLFINERQLLAFGDVEGPLIPDYEAVTLMEMAMSRNASYLNRFYHDLQTHRFSAIITNPQNTVIKDEGALIEENNVWNTYVAPYIICYYQPAQRIDTDWNRIQVYVPNPNAHNCPPVIGD